MEPKTLTINGERAVLMDVKAAVSLAYYDGAADSETKALTDTDVSRAIKYNEVVTGNTFKRILGYNSKPGAKRIAKEKALASVFKTHTSVGPRERIYFADNPRPEQFFFLDDILDPTRRVRGYTEYILYAIVTHFQHYNRN
jgi:hypothetical protein